jgi:hypothetical protein
MEQTYWLGRKRASLKSANAAKSSKARLIHFDLAGRYSVKANYAGALKLGAVNLVAPAGGAQSRQSHSDGDDASD